MVALKTKAKYKPQLRVALKKTGVPCRKYSRTKVGNFFYFGFIILAGLFTMLPLVYCVVTSFKPLDEILIFPPKFYVLRPTLQNYLVLPSILSNLRVALSRYIFNSLFISFVTTFLYVIVASMAAYVLAKTDWKGRNIYFIIVQFALLFNSYTLSLPQYLIFSSLKLIDTYWVYILPAMAGTLGVFLMKQYMEGFVPDSLLEAARIDGAGQFKTFFRIVMPIIKPCWLTLTLFEFRDIWSVVPNGTIFSENLKTLPMVMSQVNSAGIARSGSAMAVSVIMMIPPIIVYLISQSNVMEAMSSAGIKE